MLLSAMMRALQKIYKWFLVNFLSTSFNMNRDSSRLNTLRFRLPKSVHTGATSIQIIHSCCNILLESWTLPSTREYSYQILSLDNFHKFFHKIWNAIIKHNHPPIKINSFTLAFESDIVLALKYSGGNRIERFVLFTQTLVDFLTDLHRKHNESVVSKLCEDEAAKNNAYLIVNINRDLLTKKALDFAKKSVDNIYGITYGPSVHQLVHCYLLPEIETPCTVICHGLSIDNFEKEASKEGQDILFSRFVRTKDVAQSSDDDLSEADDSDCHDKSSCNHRILPKANRSGSNYQCFVTTPSTEERVASPIEADIPSCIQKKRAELNWKQSCYQESANLGPSENISFVRRNNIEYDTELNEDRALNKFTEDKHEAKRSYYAAKLTQRSILHSTSTECTSDKEEIDAIILCCGLDSRYCNCYSMDGYIPNVLCYEIVTIRFLPVDGNAWRILISKFTYDQSYAGIYKSGDLHPADHHNTDRVHLINLLDAMKIDTKSILNRKFVMTVPCDLYRSWGNKKEITIDTEDMILVMVTLNDETLLSQLNTLSTVCSDFKQNEFEEILRHSYAYVRDDTDSASLISPTSLIAHRRHVESPASTISIVVEPDICSFVTPLPECMIDMNGTWSEKNYNTPKKMVSIGIQAKVPAIPISIVCLADIRSNVITNPPITAEFLFSHGFQTTLLGDYQTRVEYLQTGRQLDTPQYIINILNDLSISMLCKDDTDVNSTLPQGLDMNYISQVDKLFTDTLEWDKEAVKGVALPFYFKNLKPAFISTENDFPSTNVARKKIAGLIIEACSVLKQTGGKVLPVLWISTKNLELSKIRCRVTSDHIFPLFKKRTNTKYSIDTIYLSESTTSKIIHNTKYGTFDTLPMELQQTSQVLLKLSDYPKPLLVIISDAYVFNTKLVQQCQALSQFENNKILEINDQPNFNFHTTVEKSTRNPRKGAKKPPNFYNESSNRTGFQTDFFDDESYESPPETILPPTLTNELNETEGVDSAETELLQQPIAELDVNAPMSIAPNEPISNVGQINMHVDQPHSLSGENNAPKNFRRSTQVGFSLPLQKKYSLIQERNREIRSRTDKMFLQKDLSKYPKPSLSCKKPIEIKNTKCNEIKTVDLNLKDKFTGVRSWLENDVPNQSNSKSTTTQDTIISKVNENQKLSTGVQTKYKLPNNDMMARVATSKKTKPSRNQITYEDMLTPVSIDEDNMDIDLETVTARLNSVIKSVENVETSQIKKIVIEEQEPSSASKRPNDDTQTAQSAGDQFKETEKLDHPAFSSSSVSLLSELRTTQEESEVENTKTTYEGGKLRIETSMEPVEVAISTETPIETELESMSLPQLMITYPKSNQCNVSTEMNPCNDTRRRIVYKNELRKKIRANIFQEDALTHEVPPQTNHQMTSTTDDADVSVDIEVSLNSSDENGPILNIGPPIICNGRDNVSNPEASIETISVQKNPIGVFELDMLKNNAKPMERLNTCTDTVKNTNVRIIDLSVKYDIGPSGNNSKQSNIVLNKRKSQHENPSHFVKRRQKQAAAIDEGSRISIVQQTPLQNNWQPPNCVEAGQLFNTSNLHMKENSPPRNEDITPMIIFSPQPPYARTPDPPYIERRDDAGNAVSEHPRCPSPYRHPMSRNMQRMSFVPTVSSVLHVRGSSRVMHVGGGLPQHIVETSSTVPSYSHLHSQSMPFMVDNAVASNINQQNNTSARCNRNYALPPDYLNSLNEISQERPLPTRDDLSHDRLPTIRPIYSVDRPQMNNATYFHGPPRYATIMGNVIPAPPRYPPRYPPQVLTRMQPPAAAFVPQYIEVAHNERMLNQMLNRHAEYNPTYQLMMQSALLNYRTNNFE